MLQTKPNKLWYIAPEAYVFEALELMAAKDIGAVPVLERGRLVGIFSERDYARKVILKGKSSRSVTIGELMTTQVYFVKPETQIEECMALITTKHIRHLPVLENDHLIGMITIGDILKEVIKDQESLIRDLKTYIIGK
jgi:CBS domain-containing protein